MDEREHQRNPTAAREEAQPTITAPAPAHQTPATQQTPVTHQTPATQQTPAYQTPAAYQPPAHTPPAKSEELEDSFEQEPVGRERIHSQPLPPLPYARNPDVQRPVITEVDGAGMDWIVPVEKGAMHTVAERLQPTLDMAQVERAKYAMKAKMTGYALNIAIGLQVLLGSLTTGLSVVTTGKQTSIMTTILGGLATLVASYLARARGSNEPELSITRVKDLEHFIRECQAFQLDYGLSQGHQFDDRVNGFRRSFEELLGNASGERKLSPPV
ncbi:hypothetical protein BD779DRAFT_1667901 [Infundibulicybe gibba]|nr:hypothetical protein BD779DRAFT_1667901 [Infundibulicybe gibba]